MAFPRVFLLLLLAVAAVAAVVLPTPTRADTTRATPSLLAYWPLDEKAGPTLLDAVGARVGTLLGGAVFGSQTARSDDAGTGIMLLGVSAVALDGAPPLPTPVTLEAWVNPRAGATGTRYILSRGTATAGVHLAVDPTNRLILRVMTSSGERMTTGATVPSDTWHHVVATVTPTAATLYLDGKVVGTGALPGPPLATTRTLYLGRYSGAASGYWRGGLDEVALHDGALDAAAVAARFAAVADVRPPAVRLASGPPANSPRADAALSFAGTKTGSTFSCRLDAGAWQPCGGSASYSGLAEGAHTASILATDRYGIAAAAPLTVSWRVDLTKPETLLLASRPAPGAAGEVSFVSETAAGFECRIDGAAWAACTSPLAAAAGATVEVRARDEAGNADPTPATARLTPETGAAPYGGASASFVVAGHRSASALQCRLNGAAWGSCPESLTFTDLPYGANALAVRDPGLPAVTSAASVGWNTPLPAPSLIAPRFPLVVTFASRRAQRRTKPSRAPRLLYRANTDGVAAVTVRRGKRTIARWTTSFRNGSNTMAFPIARLRRLSPGRHVLTLAPRNPVGAGRPLTRRFDVVRLRGR